MGFIRFRVYLAAEVLNKTGVSLHLASNATASRNRGVEDLFRALIKGFGVSASGIQHFSFEGFRL